MPLFCPDVFAHRITDLTADELWSRGVRGILLDVDNTLATHHGKTPLVGAKDWLGRMREAGFQLTIVSNAHEKRVAPFAKKLGLDYYYTCMKPLPFRLLSAVRGLGLRRRQTVIVGDQMFTDMLAGNLAGIQTVLVEPIQKETSWSFRLRRRLEKSIIKVCRRRHNRCTVCAGSEPK